MEHSAVQCQAIIQARMGSSRLPKKTLLPLAKIPVLTHVVQRTQKAKLVDRVVLATTTAKQDDELVSFAKEELKIPVFRGSEENVLDRFFECTKIYPCEIIVRITADDPLKCPFVIDKAIQILKEQNALDYVSNTLFPSYPEGVDIEVFRFSALKRAKEEASLLSEKEHVTSYIWKNPQKFQIKNFTHSSNLSHWRWTLDTHHDYEFLSIVFEKMCLSERIPPMEEVVDFLLSHPEWVAINSGIQRNAGYLASIQNEANLKNINKR